MKKIRKAVIPVAGMGTRFLPATKAIPKEMLTIVDRPTIQYIVEEVVASGIEEVVLITSEGKSAIENHFDYDFQLDTVLKQKNKRALRDELAKSGVNEFTEGVITSVAGVLLNEGKRRDFNVSTILAEAQADYPDARAAAQVMEAINKFLLHIDLDVSPLYQEAERIEAQLKTIHKQAKDVKAPGQNQPSMYG